MQVWSSLYHNFAHLSRLRLIKSPYPYDKHCWSEIAWQTLPSVLYWVHRREGNNPIPRHHKPLHNRLSCVRSKPRWMMPSLSTKIFGQVTLRWSHIATVLMSICMVIWSLGLVKPGSNCSMVVGNQTPQNRASMLSWVPLVALASMSSRRTSSGSLTTTVPLFRSSQVCVWHDLLSWWWH